MNTLLNSFVDIMFKIIPAKFRPYKLFIIKGIIKKDKKPKLFTMIMVKYKDNIINSHIYDYLFLNFGFKPKIVYNVYEESIALAINENKIYSMISYKRCFFHYSQRVKGNLNITFFSKKDKFYID